MFSSSNATSLSKSLGYTNSKTYLFRKSKDESLHKMQRFKKKSTRPLDANASPTSQTLLSNTSTDIMIELGGIGVGTLPPAWVDIYEEIQEKFKQIKNIHNDTQRLIVARIKLQFGNHEDLDAQIDLKNIQATKILQDCEACLNIISRMSTAEETPNETKIRSNIQKLLATQIQEIALLLRKQQKGLLDKLKEENLGNNSELNVEIPQDESENEDMSEMMIIEDLAKERDEDITKLVENINKLSQLFKDMNQLVIEQGTIVDRIDYNLEKAVDDTSRGKKELVKARKAMDSKCASYFIRILVILNIIFSIILVFKFAHK